MTETEIKADAKADLAHVQTVLESDELKVKAEAVKIWTRWEPYVCGAVGIVVGIALDHFLGK